MTDKKPKRNRRDLLFVLAPSLLVTLLGFVVAYQFVEPAPPTQITLAAGPEDGAYHRFALEYREALAADGIDVEIRTTRGSRENLELLSQADGDVDVALTQGGTGTAEEFPDLVGLGAVFYEPLWIFVQGDAPASLRGLEGQRLALGVEGSGTRFIARQLLLDNGINETSSSFVELGGQRAAEALLKKEVDAAFFVAATESPVIQKLLRSSVELMSIERASSYARRRRFLSAVELLQGVVDLERDIPPRETRLLAPAASLTAREDFHPALVGLFLECATRIHGNPGLFEEASEFPSPRFADYPLNEEAERFLTRGPSLLNRFLPFWAANLVDRLMVMLIPLLTLLIPLFKLFPPLYTWRVRSSFKKWYKELQEVDLAVSEDAGSDLGQAVAEVERIHGELAKITVPPSYGDELYHLRFHVSLVREKLEGHRKEEAAKKRE